MSLLEEFLNLVMPSHCIFCKAIGDVICQNCDSSFKRSPRSVRRNHLSGVATCEYAESAAEVTKHYKTHQQTSLAKFMAREIVSAANNQKISFETGDKLVPVPSTPISFGIRGFNPAKLVADQIAVELLRRSNQIISVISCLNITRTTADQASLGAAQRARNLEHSMAISKPSAALSLRTGRVWLVDDIVTTGATIAEATRALNLHSIGVSGFLVFAETARRSVSEKSF